MFGIIHFWNQLIEHNYVLEYPMYLMYRMYLYVMAFHINASQPVWKETNLSILAEKMTNCKLFEILIVLSTKTESSNCKLNSKAQPWYVPLSVGWHCHFVFRHFKMIFIYTVLFMWNIWYLFFQKAHLLHVWYVCPLCYWLIEIKPIRSGRYQRISQEFSQDPLVARFRNFWFLKIFILAKELNPRVRCAYGTYFILGPQPNLHSPSKGRLTRATALRSQPSPRGGRWSQYNCFE